MDLPQQLTAFLQRYSEELASIAAIAERGTGVRLVAPASKILLVEAADGWAAFHCPGDVKYPPLPDGITYRDCKAYSLDQVCQAYSFSIRVDFPSVGQDWLPIEQSRYLSRDSRKTVPNDWIIMTEDRRQSLKDAEGFTSTTICVKPIMHVEQGVITVVYSQRLKIWPAKTPDWKDVWSHVDLFINPSGIDLSAASATDAAHYDFIGLSIAESATTPAVSFSPGGANYGAANILNEACDELEKLIDDPATKEENIHQWLNRPEHFPFLAADAVSVRSKMPFGAKESDFVVAHSDGGYTLIEIEDATKVIFQRKGEELSKEFNHAKQQVEDWRRYINDNVHTVRQEQGLEGIYMPSGKVIMGRSKDIDTDTKRSRWRHERLAILPSNRMTAETYDDCIGRVRQLAQNLLRLTAVNSGKTPSGESFLLNPDNWHNAGVDAFKAEDYIAAATCFDQSLRLRLGDNAHYDNSLKVRVAAAIKSSPADWNTAERLTLLLFQRNPEDLKYYGMYAYAVLRLGKISQAETIYREIAGKADSVKLIDDMIDDLSKPPDGSDMTEDDMKILDILRDRRQQLPDGDSNANPVTNT